MSCVNYFLTALLAVTLPLFFFVNGFLLFGKTFDAKKHGKKIIHMAFDYFTSGAPELGVERCQAPMWST